MRPGLKTGLKLPTLRRKGQDAHRIVFEDDCSRPSIPHLAHLKGTRWHHDATRLIRYGENGQLSTYRLLLGTSKREYRIQIRYEIKKENKPLKFSLLASSSPNFQSLTLKHYLQHQTNGSLIWYRSDNTIIQKFGGNDNSINSRYLTHLNALVDLSNPQQLINSISVLKINPLTASPTVANYPNLPINLNDYLYFEMETQDAGHLFNSIKIEVF